MSKDSSPSSWRGEKRYTSTSTRRKRGPIFYLILGLVVLCCALALGVGLGVGLTKSKNTSQKTGDNSSSSGGSDSPSSSGGSGSSNGSGGNSSTPTIRPQDQTAFTLGGPGASRNKQVAFNITTAIGSPDGVQREMLVVNGQFPGPTIEVNQGDRVVITVHNNLPNATAIHWHGLFQNGTNWYDGTTGVTQCGIPPGQSMTYNFTTGNFVGTTWWHAHADTQYTDGISGAFIVHPATQPSQTPPYDEDIVIHLSDWYHQMSPGLLAQYLAPGGIGGAAGNEPVPDSGVINGVGQYNTSGPYFNFTLKANTRYRLRLINAGTFAAVRFSVDNHPLTVIEADGTLVQPLQVAGVTLAVAQRYSVLLTTAQQSGSYWIRVALDRDMFKYNQPGQNTDIRAFIQYPEGQPPVAPAPSSDPGPGGQGLSDLQPSQLVPIPVPGGVGVVPPTIATKTYPVTFSFNTTSAGGTLAYMNSTSWTPLSGTSTLQTIQKSSGNFQADGASVVETDQLVVVANGVEVMDLQVSNLDGRDHPFHLHGHQFWIVGSGEGRFDGSPPNTTSAMIRDTTIISANSWVVLRFITDNPGVWAFHCHIGWHMSAGLLMQIASQPSKIANFNIPSLFASQCSTRSS